MWWHEKNPIHDFIPLYHWPIQSHYKLLITRPPIQTVLTLMPLAILPPPILIVNHSHLIDAHFEKFWLKLREINEGETMKTLQAMNE